MTFKNGEIYHCTIEWPKCRTWTTSNVGEAVKQKELSHIADWNEKWYSHFGREFGSFLQSKHTHTI